MRNFAHTKTYTTMIMNYDVLVIGAGHAGCEAATAAAKLGARTCLVTMDMNKIAQMSCNPAMGGIAKGQIVREIDALGGMSGIITDRTAIQFRMLNRSKGPAMWSPRAQSDRVKFIEAWRHEVENTENLHIWQDQARELIVERGEACGVRTIWDVELRAKAVIITAGTFLNGLMHIGKNRVPGGRSAEPAVYDFTESIATHGIRYDRMKTGTPVRIDKRSVDFSLMERQDGESDFHRFSYIGEPRPLPQLPCWMCETNPDVHRTLEQGIPLSPLYNGQIQSIGPRYCPSIETKLITFAEKQSHLLFLEPEGLDTNEMYLNGFSSSLPVDVQLEALRHIPALRNVTTYRPGYAIEYDFFDPTQLKHTLESKVVRGLFFAGQVNGTTGYEEAAGQGLIAGINAAAYCTGAEALTLGRDEAYIGVLIDDLVTKGVDEPYRMFTSRAEYRILLRQDNADQRLTPKSITLGLATAERKARFEQKQAAIDDIVQLCNTLSVKPAHINSHLEHLGTTPLKHGTKLSELINRPQVTLLNTFEQFEPLRERFARLDVDKDEIIEAAEIAMKYRGYIERESEYAAKIRRLDHIPIKDHFDYNSITQLSTEARQKLASINPETIGQASRIPGVSPSDISVLLVLINR